MIPRSLALTAAASLALLSWPPAHAVADEPGAEDCTGVWVSVREGAPRCAADHATGREALESAGFTLAEQTPGFLCQVDAVPDTCTASFDTHWSYWQAARNADGSWGAWTYSRIGYAQSHPAPGDAEGWVLGDGATPPPPLPVDPQPLAVATPAAAHDPGSPAGTLATLGVLATGGAALGGWWVRHRRLA